jgi:hypothetical protein
MKLSARSRYCLPIAALLAAAPAWANFSWGQLGQFRPGIQLSIVLLVLLAEIAVIKPMMQMSWAVTAAAVTGANLVTGVMGSYLIHSIKFTHLDQLAILVIPSTIIEFLIINNIARQWSPRQGQRGEWAFIGVLAANLLSALVTYGYVYVNYGSEDHPLAVREGTYMSYVGDVLSRNRLEGDLEVPVAMRETPMVAHLARMATRSGAQRPFDVASRWLPWAVMRPAQQFESAIAERLDTPERARAMIWTGAPYFAAKRGVIFSDGSYRLVSEREFRQLNAVPAPPPESVRRALAAIKK